ncbi:MAG TPA: tRNA (adenosine(37)-N6)-threonylcarbamoyltransferase complex dimerization subunit type 1 TsaB [Persephonella sp.]|uniref:Putative peptidase M22 glycoprotease n=1 Tax=Persephonella marina (strain DSM 14350 / EX-H1) TaxID=123214 RepID=C0QTK0_PERMH|nr:MULTISPECIES: tRNA (adenosine(37)-N6)-threonylcarbamoyltransferase complex dimerization subunit type 1 TsaB [Persephonella]ACO03255.1 putative peptidase M22 glycoprotease [Persephonella marina EX-H1]HCB70368.1 tRNA (adenosine(37)-N6)-threonylcarbamoyltransferase complex dimerization subunit type 1 TsaB [Persephonella sp.]
MFLSIDTYSENMGIALINGHHIAARLSLSKTKPFSELIVGKLDDIFNDLGLSADLISGVVVNKGPGSYTALRVGLSVAKTVSFSLSVPIYAYESLDVIAYRYRLYRGKILVAINGGQKEAFLREYISDGKETEPLTDYSIEKISRLREDIEKYKDYLIIEKNLDTFGKNVIKDIDDLSVDGFFYALKYDLKEDPLFLQPVYLRPV